MKLAESEGNGFLGTTVIVLADAYLKFPYDAVNQANVKMQFVAIGSFPNVAGVIDCMHAAIKTPFEHIFMLIGRISIP